MKNWKGLFATQASRLFPAGVAIGLGGILCAQTLTFDIDGLQPIPGDQLPRHGTYRIVTSDGRRIPPLPCPPGDMPDAPIYALPNGQFVVDARDAGELTAMTAMGVSASLLSLPLPPGGGSTNLPAAPPPNIPNSQKYMAHAFSLVDTNYAASNDTNLYNACNLISSRRRHLSNTANRPLWD